MATLRRKGSFARKLLIGLGIAMFLLLVVAASWSRIIWPRIVVHVMATMATPNWSKILPKAAVANIARDYPPAFDSATPEDAGRALHHLVFWRPDPPSMAAVLLPFDRAREARVRVIPDSNPIHIAPGAWCREIIPLAAKGFSADQRRFLEQTVDDPDLAAFLVIGDSREMDVIGTRYSFAPRSELVFMRILPLAYYSPVKHASQLACASAALRLARGDAVGAEKLLRATANAGVLLIDNGSNALDIAVGAVLARQSLLGLAALYEATGRGAAAGKLTHDLENMAAKSFPTELTSWDQNTIVLRERLPSITASADVPAGLKWEYLVAVETLNRTAFCVGRFAFDSTYDAWRAAVRRNVVKRASDSLYFEWITAAPASKDQCSSDEPAEAGNGVARAQDSPPASLGS
jgi:hypothetical protein